eukprot:scaffold14974_cov195-Amphora_coffeaeformis.AAC.58
MNCSNAHNLNTEAIDDPWQVDCTYLALSNMLPRIMSNNSTPSESATGAQGEKLVNQNSRMARDNCGFETTMDGDVLVVQPSFDDSTRSKSPTIYPQKSAEWQTRSPDGEKKMSDSEERNPSSPQSQAQHKASRRSSGHTRSLSGRFFESTTISDELTEAERSKEDSSEFAGRKHRRMFSGDATNPNYAHRRINSIGQTTTVPRRHHHREDSGGLDILSAVAHSTKEELAGAMGQTAPWDMSRRSPDNPPPHSRPNPPPPPHRGYEGVHPAYAHHMHAPHGVPPMSQHPMNPPPHRRMPYPPPGPYAHPYPPSPYHHHYPPPPPGSSSYYPGAPHHHHSAYPPSRGRYASPYPPHSGAPPRKGAYDLVPQPPPPPPPSAAAAAVVAHPTGPAISDATIPVDKHVFERRTPTPPGGWPQAEATLSSAHQGSQTFVTSIAVGDGNKMVQTTSNSRTVATNTEEIPASKPPSEIGHHRKMSSFSSLGTMLGSNIFAGNSSRGTPTKDSDPQKGHHRKMSSNVSFLNGFDVGLEVDAAFLRNLQAANEVPPAAASAPSPVPPPPYKSEPEAPSVASTTSPQSDGSASGTKLAAGGTSKRVRRKCTVQGCGNRVVQGGLCISHGAKRKTCKHPGCNKNVKKAGLCSTHGPARKRCDHPGCPKVAVQGGRCISHGAKKKLCCVADCSKQAILAGMCKKHHDQTQAGGRPKEKSHEARRPAQSHQSGHTRGLSFFQEISPDAISTLLNPEDKEEQEERMVW